MFNSIINNMFLMFFKFQNICFYTYSVIFRQRTVVDADHRGGWTQIFGGKAYEPEISRPIERAYTAVPAFNLVPPPGPG